MTVLLGIALFVLGGVLGGLVGAALAVVAMLPLNELRGRLR